MVRMSSTSPTSELAVGFPFRVLILPVVPILRSVYPETQRFFRRSPDPRLAVSFPLARNEIKFPKEKFDGVFETDFPSRPIVPDQFPLQIKDHLVPEGRLIVAATPIQECLQRSVTNATIPVQGAS
jgi:hypothetical protein